MAMTSCHEITTTVSDAMIKISRVSEVRRQFRAGDVSSHVFRTHFRIVCLRMHFAASCILHEFSFQAVSTLLVCRRIHVRKSLSSSCHRERCCGRKHVAITRLCSLPHSTVVGRLAESTQATQYENMQVFLMSSSANLLEDGVSRIEVQCCPSRSPYTVLVQSLYMSRVSTDYLTCVADPLTAVFH